MSGVTEITWTPIKADADEELVKQLKTASAGLVNRPGLQAMYHGTPIDLPTSVETVSVWDSEDSWRAAQEAMKDSEIAKLFSQLVDTSNPQMRPYRNTVVLDKPFATVASAPVLSIVAAMVPVTVAKADWENTWAELVKAGAAARPEGLLEGISGWAKEEIEHPKVEGKSNVWVSIVGWETLEQSNTAKEGWAAGAALLAKHTEVFESHHVSFSKIE